MLQKICFVLLLTTFSSVYGGDCSVGDIDDCRVKAEQGHSWAQYNLGLAYNNGMGVLRNDKEAFKWYKKAADQGLVDAQYNVGAIYFEGQSVHKDYKEAFKWWRLAANQGYGMAQVNLGNMYHSGNGVQKDYKEAFKWSKKAADQGLSQAQYNLGLLYSNGQGVTQDYVRAYMYFSIADVNITTRVATESRDLIAKEMSPSQIAEAQRMAREWMRTH